MLELLGMIGQALLSNLTDIIALVAVLGLIFNKIQERDTALSSAYFSRMTASYEQFWTAFTKFVYAPTDEARDQFAIAVYNAVLYSSEDIAKGIQVLHRKAIERSRTGQRDAKELDELAGALEELMHQDVLMFRKRARR